MRNIRNLLFGLMALELNRVPRDVLHEVIAAGSADSACHIADVLVDRGVLTLEDRDRIERLVAQAVRAQGGDELAALNAFKVKPDFAFPREASSTPAVDGQSVSATRIDVLSDQSIPDWVAAVQEPPGRYSHAGVYFTGGMGRILVAHDQHLGRDIALKELTGAAESDLTSPTTQIGRYTGSEIMRFLREARITGQLEHPFIVPVHELGRRIDGTLYYTMRLVRGETLEEVLAKAPALRERLPLLTHFGNLCHAIAYAHSRGVIHRDIKSANVMIGEFGETVVIDWGLAKARGFSDIHADDLVRHAQMVQTDDNGPTTQTVYGHSIGTPAYMSPEQALGRVDEIDERSDVYALGVVLYELLTGQVPFVGETLKDIMRKVVLEPPPNILLLEPQAPRELVAISEKAMAKDPAERYQSAKELADEIARFLAGGLVRAYEYTFTARIVRFVVRYKAAVAVAVASLLLLIGLSATYNVRLVRQRAAAQASEREARTRQAEAENERAIAGEAREHAEQARNQAEYQYYLASIGLAQQSIREQRFEHAEMLLATCPVQYRQWEWGRLEYLCHPDLMTLRGHTKSVWAVAFSPDGTLLASAGSDQAIELWEVKTGREVRSLVGHTAALSRVCFSPDGRRLASASVDGRAVIWDVETGSVVKNCVGHEGDVNGVAFSPDGKTLATCGADKSVRLWNAESGTLLASAFAADSLESVAFDPRGEYVATAGKDKTAIVWTLHPLQPFRTLTGHTGSVQAVAFSPDGRRLASAGRDKTAKLWEVESGRLLHTLTGHTGAVWYVAFDSTGDRLATSSSDRSSKLWDTRDGSETRTISGHSDTVGCTVFSPDGATLASCGDDSTIRLWNAVSSRDAWRLNGHQDIVNSIAFSPDGKRLVSCSGHWLTLKDASVRLWDLAGGRQRILVQDYRSAIAAVAFHPDGKRIAMGGRDGIARLLDLESGAEMQRFQGHHDAIHSLAFSPDGTHLATGSYDCTAKVWNLAAGRSVLTLIGHTDYIDMVRYSPDGGTLATASRDRRVKLWDARSGRELQTLAGHTQWVGCLAFAPDGRNLATGGYDNLIKMWDLETGTECATLQGHTGPVYDVAFSPDGNRLVSGSRDTTMIVWAWKSEREVLRLRDHDAPVKAIAFSPDGLTLASGSFDKTVLLSPAFTWDMSRYPGREDQPLPERLELYKREFWSRFSTNAGH